MPIVDIQKRFRELGRIRTGHKVATQSGKTRPAKLPRFRLTSPWQHLIEQAAEVYGGTPAQWHNDGTKADEYEVIIAEESLDVVIPPGEILDQWYELWTGGGCARRCDGERQVLVDRPCSCPADPIERQELAGKGQACKPTTRLRLMLPRVADVGIWRLESHGFHAAAELGGSAGLVEAASRMGALIPADLRLAAREGARRPGEQVKKFFVPALSFRGELGPVLDRLGILEAGSSMPRTLGDGVERRPALDAGGQAALPAGTGNAFDPAPVEPEQFPPAPFAPPAQAIEPPADPGPASADEPGGFAPPPPATADDAPPVDEPGAFEPPAHDPDAGGDGPSYTGPQIVAMRFTERGIGDRALRLRMVSFVIGRAITSCNDLTAREVSNVLAMLNDDSEYADLVAVVPPDDDEADPVDDEDGSAEDVPDVVKPDAVTGPGTSTADDSDIEPGDEFDGPTPTAAPRRRRPAPTADPLEPSSWAGDRWRDELGKRGVKVSEALREAARLARDAGKPAPSTLDEISESGLGELVLGYAEQLSLSRQGDPT